MRCAPFRRIRRASASRYWRSTTHRITMLAAALALTSAGTLGSVPVALGQSASGCSFLSAPSSPAAFCDTFDQPAATPGSRSGDLNGLVWGVSRATSNDNSGAPENWAAVPLDVCGSSQLSQTPRDVRICNGQLVEGMDDNTAVAVLAMYPRQPFDIAGRTGTVRFDVSNDTQGPHAAWPVFSFTDQPVPAPYANGGAVSDWARNSFGFSMAEVCTLPSGCGSNLPTGQPSGTLCWTIDRMWITASYQEQDIPFSRDGCVLMATQYGVLNHVEVQLSPTSATVFATDPGQSTLRQIAHASVSMPLTRGLLWMEDVHYNASKPPDTQRNHTFVWDNFAFDGPSLPRDLGFDILDNTTPGPASVDGYPTQYIGWSIPPNGGSLTLQIPNVSNISQASAALLEFTFTPHSQANLSYQLNGHGWQSIPWPFGSNGPTYTSQTIAVPVSLNQIVPGTNTLQLQTADPGGVSVANFDLILVGAGGTSGPSSGGGTPTPTPTPAPPPGPGPGPGATSTLGLTRVGTQTDDGDANHLNGSRVVVGGTPVTTTSISVYVTTVDSAPQNQFAVAVYSDNNGAPGSLVAKSGTGSLVANSWNTLPITASLQANHAYWLMYSTNGSSGAVNNMPFNNSSTPVGAYTAQQFGTWPTAMTGAARGNWQFSIYATVH